MTPEEFEKEMQKIRNDYNYAGSRELCHELMDDIMCDVLIELGYGDGVNIFLDIDKWYS